MAMIKSVVPNQTLNVFRCRFSSVPFFVKVRATPTPVIIIRSKTLAMFIRQVRQSLLSPLEAGSISEARSFFVVILVNNM